MQRIFEKLKIPNSWARKPNPLVDYCHQISRRNALRLQVIANKKNVIKRFNEQNFALLTALAYPHADEERISIINDFHAYLFFNDDIAEQNEEVGKKLTKIVPIFRAHVRALSNGTIENPDDPLCSYLVDIRERLLEFMSANWLHRFSKNVEDYLMKGTLVGAQNWMFGKIPTPQKYEEQRKFDSSVFACQDLIEVSEKFELPDDILYRYDIQRLKELSNLVVAYSNDLFSYHKEVNIFASPNNIVYVVMNHKKLPLHQAVETVIDIINKKVAEYKKLEKELPHWGDPEKTMVDLYLKGLKSWMRGNVDWSMKSRRYHSADSPFPELRQESFGGDFSKTEPSSCDGWR